MPQRRQQERRGEVINTTPFPTTAVGDLARRCTEMVQNAQQLTGRRPITPSSLNLSSGGLAQVLQSATANNSPQQATGSINTRGLAYAGVGSRLVRSGRAPAASP